MHELSTSFRQRALKWAIALPHAPAPAAPVAARPIAHMLYCSQARYPLSEDQLADLLEQTRANNEQRGITGLLCYSEGHFVQVLEGPGPEVDRLYTRIEQDPRHHHVQVLSRGTGEQRQFPDWRMALAKTPQDFYWLITSGEARRYQLLLPQIPILEPTLTTLLHVFGSMCTSALWPGRMLGAAHWAVRPILAAV